MNFKVVCSLEYFSALGACMLGAGNGAGNGARYLMDIGHVLDDSWIGGDGLV